MSKCECGCVQTSHDWYAELSIMDQHILDAGAALVSGLAGAATHPVVGAALGALYSTLKLIPVSTTPLSREDLIQRILSKPF